MFACVNCGTDYAKRRDECRGCGLFGSIVAAKRDGRRRAVCVADLAAKEIERVQSGHAAWDLVVGGGTAVGSVIVVAGVAGVGKTTIVCHVAAACARAMGGRALVLSAEMSADGIAATARRARADLGALFVIETRELTAASAAVETEAPRVVVLDSIQRIGVPGLGEDAAQKATVREAMRWAQSAKRIVILVSQLTKEGAVAGPQGTIHDVDTIVWVRKKELRVPSKNRFGPTPVKASLGSSVD